MSDPLTPDFFGRPPPPGRSRESTIVLDAEGRFSHDGAPVEHGPMAQAFARWVARHPDDGRYILNNGVDWCYLRVEDTPFFVEQVRDTEGVPWLRLSDETWEPLEPSSVWVGPREALYLAVKAGRFHARFRQGAQAALAPWLIALGSGGVGLAIHGQAYPLATGPQNGDGPAKAEPPTRNGE